MELWETEAFKRWWDEDWSWEGLKRKGLRANLGDNETRRHGNLQQYWHEEEAHLITFGNRVWTRVHLPPFDDQGNPCPPDVFTAAKAGAETLMRSRLTRAQTPDEELLKKGLGAVQSFADLRGVVFAGTMNHLPFVADASSAIFLEEVDLSYGAIAARFNDASFMRRALFVGAQLAKRTSFSKAWFHERALFNSVQCADLAIFRDSLFEGSAVFDSAQFKGRVDFRGALFELEAWFVNACFGGSANFDSTWFVEQARFDDTQFARRVSFARATFERRVSFRVPRHAAARDFPGIVTFTEAKFGTTDHDNADFSGRRFSDATYFSRARVAGPILFHGAELHPETTLSEDAFNIDQAAHEAAERWFKDSEPSDARWQRFVYFGRFPFRLRWPGMARLRHQVDSVVLRHELAFRTLRLQFAQHQNTEYEMMFYKLELDARLARGSIPLIEALFIRLYKASSGYGASLLRPILCFCAVMLAGAALLTLLGASAWTAFPANLGWTLELQTSLPNWGNDATAGPAAWHALGEGTRIALHYALTIATVGLVAVFLIALRRRFHIGRS